ncbi:MULTISPECIES: flagellar protein FliT [unclassified Paenibacillus]|uniref:flagellar protein FliT n=1 Tax=unclassified Paenibacillus TaxID=185978 RepID=UPI0036344834
MSKTEGILLQVEALTCQMVQNLEFADYHDLSEFVFERERLLAEIKEVPLAEYEQRINQILDQDKLIGARMMAVKEEAQKAIDKFQTADKYKQAYDKDYTMDSVFFNRRK